MRNIKNDKKFKLKTPIFVTACFGLAFKLISVAIYIVINLVYDLNYIAPLLSNLYVLFSALFSCSIVFCFSGKIKTTPSLLISFTLFTITEFLFSAESIIYDLSFNYLSFDSLSFNVMLSSVLLASLSIVSALSIINNWKKPVMVICLSIQSVLSGFFAFGYTIPTVSDLIKGEPYLLNFPDYALNCYQACFYYLGRFISIFSLMLFAIANKAPRLKKKTSPSQSAIYMNISIENELKALMRERESESITAEEYRQRRQEILKAYGINNQ